MHIYGLLFCFFFNTHAHIHGAPPADSFWVLRAWCLNKNCRPVAFCCCYEIRRTTAASRVACSGWILSSGACLGGVGRKWRWVRCEVFGPGQGRWNPGRHACLHSHGKKTTPWRMSDRLNVHQNCLTVWLCALCHGGSNNNNLKACLDTVSEPLSLPPLGSTQPLTSWPS